MSTTTGTRSSVNPDEIALFSRLSSHWWDERGEFQMLHKMNPIRVQFIREKLLEMRREDGEDLAGENRVLEGLNVLDVGCGGGLLCESLSRLGANTLGIDASASNIGIASLHASSDPSLNLLSSVSSSTLPSPPGKGKGTLTYEHTSAEDVLATRGPKQFDVVCSMEVLEHVDNPRVFLRNCANLVKPGGHLFLSTISRTPLAYLLTIFAAEDVLRLVTPGTHTYSKFVRPEELTQFFCEHRSSPEETPWISRLYGGLPTRTEAETRGMIYVPWKSEWALVPRGAVGASWGEGCNYLFWVRRPLE
ncbi:S-adenosyl-L-methionine-dependent methyltransferase [Fomitopsis serialis]|uniref:S-adenosyl-L-methionine-dependent methyltransferase n=1 Tax=Fomitopsis serialis TaxID=139415 RepID=UPI00200733B0|nr:S-adenosyl-L-methionine-dependent methyltransferase [Neoantrodia serialis]KAH9933519.1 S-adenosyl-L-methionine-dependent methyltransferase [Neoantrodia serialis]